MKGECVGIGGRDLLNRRGITAVRRNPVLALIKTFGRRYRTDVMNQGG